MNTRGICTERSNRMSPPMLKAMTFGESTNTRSLGTIEDCRCNIVDLLERAGSVRILFERNPCVTHSRFFSSETR